MRILLGYGYYNYPFDVKLWVEAWLERLRSAGFEVYGFPVTLNPPNNRLWWADLDVRWKRGDRELLSMYEELAEILIVHDYDVFVNWNGINMHPDFIRQLPTFNVFGCFDDPESSAELSIPAAWAYDLSMVGNIAELGSYRKWGVEDARFWPMGFMRGDYDPALTKEKILTGERDIDISLLCERKMYFRAERLDKFSSAFPSGSYYGTGWPNGFLPENKKVSLYQRTKIGPNFHNSTGPINFRTYILPANGVLQLCDNKSHLGSIFQLGKEVIGFDTIEEAIDLARYFLDHDEERRIVAAAGWERAIRDYNEVAVFSLVEKYVNEVKTDKELQKNNNPVLFIKNHQKKTTAKRVLYVLHKPIFMLRSILKRFIRRITRYSLEYL